jgi:hypothetical protein
MIVILGILMLSGILLPDNADKSLTNVMGIVFILFGLYRLAMYHTQRKRYYHDDDE